MKICAAPDCSNVVKNNKRIYCSDRCRYRYNKQRLYKQRAKKGLCVQCGGEYDAPVSPHKSKVSPKYCSKCQSYFNKSYKARKDKIGGL